MKITKYEHACFAAEKDGQMIIVDPGEFSTDLVIPENVVAVVVTHEHDDHFDPNVLAAIYDKNPNSLLISLPEITAKMPDHLSRAVQPGDTVQVGPFSMQFFGGQHAIIHPDYPMQHNVGVMINDTLYFPGDSLVAPDKSVDTLALPAAGPWMKVGEAMDFMVQIKPRLAFPTHDASLSAAGKAGVDNWFGRIAEKNGVEYKRLTDPIDI